MFKLIDIFGHVLIVNSHCYGRGYVKKVIPLSTFLKFHTHLEENSVRSFQNDFDKSSRVSILVVSRNWIFHGHRHILGYHPPLKRNASKEALAWRLRTRSTTVWPSYSDISPGCIPALHIATLENSEIILQLAHLKCISLQGMDSTVDEPPIEDNPFASKRREAENSQVRGKALFLNRRTEYLLPAPVREEAYPLETISARRGKNRQWNMWFYTGSHETRKTLSDRILKSPRRELKIRRTGVQFWRFQKLFWVFHLSH